MILHIKVDPLVHLEGFQNADKDGCWPGQASCIDDYKFTQARQNMCVGRMLTDSQHIVDTHVRPGPANVTAGRAALPLGGVVVLATTLEPAATIIALVANNSCKW